MNQADLGSKTAPNTPLPPRSEPVQQLLSSGTSTFAVLVGIGFLLMTTFFILSFVAVWKRSEAGASPPTTVAMALPTTTTQLPVPAGSEDWRKGTVNVTRPGLKTGVLHTIPGLTTPRAAYVPNGTIVDVGRASTTDGQTWYHVRAVVNGDMYDGWMHSDIVNLTP